MPIILNGTTGNISGSSLTGITTGKVLQIVSTTKKDVFSEAISAGGISADITGLTVSITPANASNKIFLMANRSISGTPSSIKGMTFYKDS